MKFKAHVGLSGSFPVIEVLSPDGKVKRRIDGPKNLITDIGLERLGSVGNSQSLYPFCRVGSGNSEPDPDNRQLDNQLGSAGAGNATAVQGVNLAGGYAWARITWTFGVGAVVGNVSEIGTGWAATGDTLFSRALVRDVNGNPTSISILSDEQLRVTWEHHRYWQQSPNTGTISNEGNKGGDYIWQASPRQVQDWLIVQVAGSGGGQIISNGSLSPNSSMGTSQAAFTVALSGVSALGDINSPLTGGVVATPAGSCSASKPSPTSLRWTFSFNVSQGNNAAGINGFHFACGGSTALSSFQFKALIDPPLMKTSDDFLRVSLDLSWGRHEPA